MSEPIAVPNDIILFHYDRSPYGKRVRWYLAFRQIAYAECIQPPILPRPDQNALGVQYRRSPVMAVGRDVYLDSRLIIHRLEELFPASEQHPTFSTRETEGLARLLNKLVVDASLFVSAVNIMPVDSPAFSNESFLKDRAGFFGEGWKLEDTAKRRPEGLSHTRECFDIIEALFADGRDWVGGTAGPTLADLEGVWVIDWVLSQFAPPEEYFAEEVYPKIYSWWKRFKTALKTAQARGPKAVTLQGADAVPHILAAAFSDRDLVIDKDPLGLQSNAEVELLPTDSGGLSHKDTGRLIKLTKAEVAIAVKAEKSEVEVHVHAPRWKFSVKEIGNSRL